MSAEGVELRAQLSRLDQETEEIKQMSTSVDELQDKLEANKIAKKRLRNKLLNLGYNL